MKLEVHQIPHTVIQRMTSAFTEAQRLARMLPGKFFVMEAKGAAVKLDVQVSRFDSDDTIPF